MKASEKWLGQHTRVADYTGSHRIGRFGHIMRIESIRIIENAELAPCAYNCRRTGTEHDENLWIEDMEKSLKETGSYLPAKLANHSCN